MPPYLTFASKVGRECLKPSESCQASPDDQMQYALTAINTFVAKPSNYYYQNLNILNLNDGIVSSTTKPQDRINKADCMETHSALQQEFMLLLKLFSKRFEGRGLRWRAASQSNALLHSLSQREQAQVELVAVRKYAVRPLRNKELRSIENYMQKASHYLWSVDAASWYSELKRLGHFWHFRDGVNSSKSTWLAICTVTANTSRLADGKTQVTSKTLVRNWVAGPQRQLSQISKAAATLAMVSPWCGKVLGSINLQFQAHEITQESKKMRIARAKPKRRQISAAKAPDVPTESINQKTILERKIGRLNAAFMRALPDSGASTAGGLRQLHNAHPIFGSANVPSSALRIAC